MSDTIEQAARDIVHVTMMTQAPAILEPEAVYCYWSGRIAGLVSEAVEAERERIRGVTYGWAKGHQHNG